MWIQTELFGRVGKIPQVIGGAGVRFSVAVDAAKKDQPPIWVDVVCFGKSAEAAVSFILEPGQLVFVSGRPEARAYTAKDGTAKSALNVVASMVRVITFAKKQQDQAQESESLVQESERLGFLPSSLSPSDSALPF